MWMYIAETRSASPGSGSSPSRSSCSQLVRSATPDSPACARARSSATGGGAAPWRVGLQPAGPAAPPRPPRRRARPLGRPGGHVAPGAPPAALGQPDHVGALATADIEGEARGQVGGVVYQRLVGP